MKDNLRTCNRCGWVSYGVTRKDAERSVAEFNKFYEAAPAATRESFGGPSTILHYEVCIGCGGSYKNTRDSSPDDCPVGCTLNPIIVEEA